MDEQPTVAELWELLQEQRAKIAHLEEALASQQQRASRSSQHAGVAVLPKLDDTTPSAIERRLTRAGLLKGAAAGAIGLTAAAAAGEGRAAASTPPGEAVLQAQHFRAQYGTHDAIFTLGFGYDRGVVVQGQSLGVYGESITPQGTLGSGVGVQGDSGSGVGVQGTGGTGTGVKGFTTDARRLVIGGPLIGGTGVAGESLAGVGVRGFSHQGAPPPGSTYLPGIGVLGIESSNRGIGVAGRSYVDASLATLGGGTGVQGASGSGAGVQGKSASGLGVQGDSDSLIGVQGTTAGNLFGVYGRNIASRGTGVTGRVYTDGSQTTLGAGTGVLGESGSGSGVWGTTIGGSGVQGTAYSDGTHTSLGSGTGVWGQSGTGTGVQGTSTDIGVKGVSTGFFGAGVLGTNSNSGSGVWGRILDAQGNLGLGNGVLGQSGDGGNGVKGTATGTGTGVWAEGGVGVRGYSFGSQLTGVYGINTANDGTGVAGRSYADAGQGALGAGIGAWGDSGSGIGVKGSATTGRGGVFSGGAAQLQLVPSSQQSPPTSGQTGDLFLDSSAKLWLCTAGGANAVWVTMGTGSGGGGGGGTGPLVAHSAVIATPGVYGDNTTDDPSSIGISGASVDGNGNPGAGTGVQGSTGSGTALKGVATSGTGVYASGAFGVEAHAGSDGIGVDAHADGAGTAVKGTCGLGRGGVFFGGTAQLQLVPANGSHPFSGQDGDLFLDSSKQLWLCTAGGNQATWLQLGAGGGGSGGPLNGTSTSTAIAGVEGDNTQAGWGVRGRSQGGVGVQGEDTLGSGTGVYGSSSGGTGVAGQSSTGIGVVGNGGAAGVYASSSQSNGVAVAADAGPGVGGRFKGATAQLRLTPLNGARPTSGTAGDLVVDSSNQLWFCQGGTTWVQLA